MHYKVFHNKLASALFALTLLLSVQTSISHAVDFEPHQHSEQECSLWQNCGQLMGANLPIVAVMHSRFIKTLVISRLLPQLSLIAARVRGPPIV